MSPRLRSTIDVMVCVLLSPLLIVVWLWFVLWATWLDVIDGLEGHEK